jgi:MtN3 and saliva related transmembrane protein
MQFITFIGLIAGTFTGISLFPQVLKSWRTRETKDLSFPAYSILLIGITFWLIYGIVIKDLPLIFANIVAFTLTSAVLILKLKYK